MIPYELVETKLMTIRTHKEMVFTFRHLLAAYYSCRKNKRSTHHAASFETDFERGLILLEKELQNKTYRPSRSICFVVEWPTLREVFAATFRDRIVHHLLYDCLEPIFEPRFIDHSFACRPGKGALQSVRTLKISIRKVTKNHRKEAFFLHMDVKGFFMSIDKDILFQILSRTVKNPDLIWLSRLIIYHDPTRNFFRKSPPELFRRLPDHKSLFHVPKNHGLPIGNLTSQFFANIYLNELDQFAKHTLKAKHYFRYVDDFLFLSDSRDELARWQTLATTFLKQRLDLDINSDKTVFGTIEEGMDWLGYIVKPHQTLVRRRIVSTLRNKIRTFDTILAGYTASSGQIPLPFTENLPSKEELRAMIQVVNSYLGHFRHANTYRLRKNIVLRYLGHLSAYVTTPNISFSSIRLKPEYDSLPETKE